MKEKMKEKTKQKQKKISNKSFFEELLSNQNFLRLFSLVLAVICWLLVVTIVDEDTTVVISNIPVEIDMTNTTAQKYGLSLIDGSGQNVSIRVKGRRVDIGQLTASDFYAHAIVSDVNKTGEYELFVEVDKNNTSSSYNVIKTVPSRITASFDYLDETSFEVVGKAENLLPEEGYIKDTIVVRPETVELIGPKSQITKIASCVAVSKEKGTLTETTMVNADLVFYDAIGNELDLPDVDFRNQEFSIMVPIYKQKTVPIVPTFVNVPYGLNTAKLDYTLSDKEISIAGREDLIDSIESVSLSEIDFRKIDLGSTFRQSVNLSAGLINLNYLENVTVSFDADTLSSVNLDLNNIIISNPSSLYDVELMTTRIPGVKIVGEKADIQKLSGSDFVANVDLANAALSQGTIRVAVNIHALNDLQAWAVGEYAVTLKVTAKS